ncbi:hypothetical protein ACYFX5_24120 [Bremerella sp. T1]|uniref:hypothetical protein n=1 Tax=Bremerella sp. TYQ1 TaxID=3119568 RepID=UPI001CCC8225|nr:hypothetical protein [Bremerella volcania]UBM36114.1 hypothetical protein LA756_26065 [Bremerella volcania]
MHAPIEPTTANRVSQENTWAGRFAPMRHPLILWLINAGILLLLAGWIIWDARFSSTWDHLQHELGLAGESSTLDEFANTFFIRWKIYSLAAIAIVSTLSLSALAVGLMFGGRGYRSLASWMVVLSLACGWLGLLAGWDEMIWVGKRLRIDSHVAAFEPIADSLRTTWPKHDGQQDHLGPFMAYPAGKPKTLILLTTPEIAKSGPTFSSVERSDAGGIRFQLSGNERGVWLEWHPDGNQPDSFVGGLLEPHHLLRSVPLGDGWYLARYDQAAMAS